VSREEEWSYRDSQGRLFCTVEGRLSGDSGALLPSDGEAVGEVEVRGALDHRLLLQGRRPGPSFHDGWLRTGDVGSMDERGFIRLTDRAKDVDQVRWRVDLLDGTRERPDGPPRRGGGPR